MKQRITLILFFLLTCFTGVASINDPAALPDSLFTQKYIRQIHLNEPKRAMELLEIAEDQHRMPQFRIDELRSIVYQRMDMPRLALKYISKVLESDSAKSNPECQLSLMQRQSTILTRLSKHSAAIHVANQYIGIARKLNNRLAESIALHDIGQAYIALNQIDKGFGYIRQAVELLENTTNAREMAQLSYYYGNWMASLANNERYEEAIKIGEIRKKCIDKMSVLSGLPDGYVDQQYGFLYAKMACIYLYADKPAEAEECYRNYLDTKLSSSPFYNTEALPFLLKAERYKEALELCDQRSALFENKDTINDSYRALLINYADVYAGLENYKQEAQYRIRYEILQDSLFIRTQDEATAELATLFHVNEKEIQIQQQQADLKVRKLQLTVLIGLALLLIVLLALNYRHTRIVRGKNSVLAKKIDQQINYQEALFALKEEKRRLATALALLQPADSSVNAASGQEDPDKGFSENKNLFDELNHILISRKLYLSPDLNRDELTSLLNINKNRFALLIQENTGGNLKEYLNNLRADHAILLLKKHSEYTFQAIATDSGFTNMGTFYNTFRKKTGMTPSEYRNIINA